MARFRIGTVLLPSLAIALVGAAPVAAEQWTEVAPEEVGMSSDRLQRLTDVMQAYVDDGQIAGLVILIAKDGPGPLPSRVRLS